MLFHLGSLSELLLEIFVTMVTRMKLQAKWWFESKGFYANLKFLLCHSASQLFYHSPSITAFKTRIQTYLFQTSIASYIFYDVLLGCMCVRAHAHTCMCVCVFLIANVCTCVCNPISVCVCVYIYMCIYIYMCVCVHMQSCVRVSLCFVWLLIKFIK